MVAAAATGKKGDKLTVKNYHHSAPRLIDERGNQE